jgi:hypothetical protein
MNTVDEKEMTLRGLPTASKQFAPLVLLVPHLMIQNYHKSVSFIHIINLIKKMQVMSYFEKKETQQEFNKMS